jgi:hypothetical protein
VTWPLAQDPALERRVNDLLATMTVEEKVAQLVQGDISTVTPDDVRKYRLGSVLAGGNSDPGGRYNAKPAEWLALADAFHEASMDTSQGGKAIPVIFGIDAVHGQSNIVGATLFPHNIGMGATRNPELLRRIGEITALETRVTRHGMGLRTDRGGAAGRPLGPLLRRLFGVARRRGQLFGRGGRRPARQGRYTGIPRWPPRDVLGQAFPGRRRHDQRQGPGRHACQRKPSWCASTPQVIRRRLRPARRR